MNKFLSLITLSAVLSTTAYSATNKSYPFLAQTDLIYDVDDVNETPPVTQSGAEPALLDAPPAVESAVQAEVAAPEEDKILVRFTDINAAELVRFISRISQKNFIFNERELGFNITIVSDEPTTVDNIMTALLQELRIHGLTIIEEGNNIIIHRNPNVNSISRVSTDDPALQDGDSVIVTQVFQLNTLEPVNAATLITPLTSGNALVEASPTTQHLIVTDLESNIRQISLLLKSLDAPNSGLVIGQYVIQVGLIDSLVLIAQQIMLPIAREQPLHLVPHRASNSIFIVSSPFLVEKTISVLQNLDQLEGTTRIMDLQDMRVAPTVVPIETDLEEKGRWELDPTGRWVFKPFQIPTAEDLLKGGWQVDPDGRWFFEPKGGLDEVRETPRGDWIQTPEGEYLFRLAPGESISTKRIERVPVIAADLPVGHVERTQFYLHKLLYRKGLQIMDALQRIGESLAFNERENEDLISTISTIQWIEETNALVYTGTTIAVAKVKELIEEIDTPLRQVFIEVLILETDIEDSLTYGVNWMTRFGGGNTAGAQAFLTPGSPLPGAMNTTGINSTPNANSLATSVGYSLGIIGQTISKNGTEFASIGALVRALHQNSRTNIVLNPKILTEDNYPAEIFVGINTQFQTDSIVNDEGSIVTTNFEFRDVGTTLRVTPRISNTDVITLEIEQEVSSVIPTPLAETASTGAGPSTRQNRTFTRVHIPNKFFLVLSGMIEREYTRTRGQVPCLGGIPVLGGLFSEKDNFDRKRNIMIFIRPEIIDTEDEIQNLTKHQQDIYKDKGVTRSLWKYEVDETLDLLNLREECGEECR